MNTEILDSCTGMEDIPSAEAFFLAELKKGPFAPALAGEGLDRFKIQQKLVEFVRDHLANQVAIFGYPGMTASPVGRPALALRSRVHDPAYWAGYRLSSLFKVWTEAANRVDMSALNRIASHEVRGARAKSILSLDDFTQLFQIGARLKGTITRVSYRGVGLIVEVVGCNHPCLLPTDNIPLEFRDHELSLIGVFGEFEVISVMPQTRSVLLKVLRLDSGNKGGANSASQPNPSSGKSDDLERKLALSKLLFDVKALRDKRWLPDAIYEQMQNLILAAL